ncbi:eukaryotic translation initiation factor 3 subunit c isoform X2 [Arctopsyche grandis]|uniref:eukaryotic translation initiation factor 3 subunit c isoform X2 n=1 Tax=Arctopsyche grandis TaxID=121162 RepID=UPI00406D8F8B
MSRFFATGTDSESESSSEEEQVSRQPPMTFTFSDDEEETRRVVRSTKEKRFEELTSIIKNIRNYKKIKDMTSMLSSFEDLQKAYTKALPVVMKETNGQPPEFFLRCLIECETFVAQLWEDRNYRKNMSKSNSKSLTSLRQKLRKYCKEMEPELAHIREQPELPEQDGDKTDDDSSDSEAHEVGGKAEAEAKVPQVTAATATAVEGFTESRAPDDDDSEDSIDWGSDSSSSGDSSDEYDKNITLRERFLKRTTERDEEEERERRRERRRDRGERERPSVRRARKAGELDDGEGAWETVRNGVATTQKPKMFSKEAEVDVPAVVKKLEEVVAARGKKRTDRRLQLELLRELLTISDAHNLGPAVAAKLKAAIAAAYFDYNAKVSDSMKPEHWNKLVECVQDLVDLLIGHEDLVVSEMVPEEAEQLVGPPWRVNSCAVTAVERLDDEFIKLLKECDPHSNEYVDRLKDEIRVSSIIDKIQKYVEKRGVQDEVCRIYLRKIDHLYYKFDPTVLKQKAGELPAGLDTSIQVMNRLCKYIYANDNTGRLRTRAILSHMYHYALHDDWFRARDLLLMSHLQETINHSDPSTQILYNRTMANLGLCAFRYGNIKDAHACLVDLMVTGKPKELLAQGLLPQRQHERSKEQEKIEKQRQMPFHMHINLELLECVYFVSAMLIEIPYMAAHEFDARRRMISKTFYQNLRASERQSLVGPPESMREHVVAAARAMRHGNWELCYNYIVNPKMNAKVWDLFYQADLVREMLLRLIREESMRTYLFTYSNVYASVSLETLQAMFQLPKSAVHSLVSKMIIGEELLASMDDPSGCIVLHRCEPSRLQALALQLTDKLFNFVDSNERIFEMKQNPFFQRGNVGGYGGRDRGGGRGGQERGGGGGRGGDGWQRRGQRNQRRHHDDRGHDGEGY